MNNKLYLIFISILCAFTASGETINHSIRIYADTIEIYEVIDKNLPDYKYSTQKDIVMCSYLENGVFTMKKPVIIDHRSRVYKSKGADSYRPLLEEGKEWRYTMYNPINRAFPDYRPGPIEVNRVIRLENPIEIDGETYLQANAYYDDEHQHDEYNPIICLREDVNNKKVIIKRYPEDHFYADHYTGGMYLPLWENNGNDTLYNFINPLASLVANFGKSASPNEFECLDGQHKGFDLELHTGDFSMIEGVGIVHKDIDHTCDLFGFACSQMANLPDWCYYPYLYEVANADGTVIYRNPDFAPGWTSISSAISDSEITVDIEDGTIKVRCTDDAADVWLYNTQGIRVSHATCISGSGTIPTSGLTRGVYILQCGSHIRKVTL